MKVAAQNNSSDLDYSNFPDKVKDIMKVWDGDESGSVSVSELVLAAEAQKKIKDADKKQRRTSFAD